MIKDYIKYKSFKYRKNKDFYSLLGHKVLKCIYIHIPKTGGVSINKSLYYCMGGGHRTAIDYMNELGENIYQSYYTFTVFRDPIKRFISAYNYVFSGGNCVEDEKWLNDCKFKDDHINEIINLHLDELIKEKLHFLPQVNFIKNRQNRVIVDNIINFENLDSGFKEVCGQLKIKRKLERLNIIKKKKVKISDLSDAAFDKLNNLYQEDIEFYKNHIDSSN